MTVCEINTTEKKKKKQVEVGKEQNEKRFPLIQRPPLWKDGPMADGIPSLPV